MMMQPQSIIALCFLCLAAASDVTLVGPFINGRKHSIASPHNSSHGIGCLSAVQHTKLTQGITVIAAQLTEAELAINDTNAAATIQAVRNTIVGDLELIAADPCPTCTAVRLTIHDNLHSQGFIAPNWPQEAVGHIREAQWRSQPAMANALNVLATAVALAHKTCSFDPVYEALTSWDKHAGHNCYNGHGGVASDPQDKPLPGKTITECEAACRALAVPCTAITVQAGKSVGDCWLRASVTMDKCSIDTPAQYDTYTAPAPSPSPPSPPSPPAPPPASRAFMVLGDWGYNPQCHGNVKSTGQKAIARDMKTEFDRRAANASLPNVEFVINVGDSFYASGVNSVNDPRWQDVWAGVYSLPGTTWYSTYGNHDLGNQDSCGTSLSAECIQIQKHGSTMNGMTWYLPEMSYTVESPLPGLDVGIISLDTNVAWSGEICKYIHGDCANVLQARYQAAQRLLDSTIDKAVKGEFPKNMLVFSHYPSDYCGGGLPSSFCESLKRSGENGTKIHYFAGHRHATDDTSVAASKVGDAKSWLVGGGGGWGCDGSPNGQWENQGFLIGEVDTSGKVTSLKPIYTPRNKIC